MNTTSAARRQGKSRARGIALGLAAVVAAMSGMTFGPTLAGAELRTPESPKNAPIVENPLVKLEATEKNFPYAISVVQRAETGSGARASSTLAVIRVRGTRPEIEPGGVYWIEGKYTLASADKARLSLILSTDRHVWVKDNPTHHFNVERGSGTFSFLTELTTPGMYRVAWDEMGKEKRVAQAGSVRFSDR